MDFTATSVGADSARLEDVVATAESTLVDAEVSLETLRVEVDKFTRLHHSLVGPLYARLDELEALVAEATAALSGKPEDIRRAYEARSKVSVMPPQDEPDPVPTTANANETTETGDRTETAGPGESASSAREVTTGLRPGKLAQRLYRELARRAHPDLVQDPEEKRRRDAFISRVNEAYRQGDLARLQKLSEEWTVTTTPAPSPDSPSRAPWLRGRLIWLRARLAELGVQREGLLNGPMGSLLAEYDYDAQRALDELTTVLAGRIQDREGDLRRLLGD